MSQLFLLPDATRENRDVEAWFAAGEDELRRSAKHWFDAMRNGGADVRILLHDGHPTACVGEAAFGYVNAFSAHLNVGFFHGADLPDPAGLLEGSGKRMRHVKLHWGQPVDTAALTDLIKAAYRDVHSRLDAAADPTL